MSTIIDRAVDWIIGIATDDSHGYDQGSRWGPDYDCSSLVISAYKHAGLPLQSTYTGNMKPDFIRNGFIDVTSSVNIYTGDGVLKGDVLLNIVNHTAMCIGGGKIAQASGNEWGGAIGGQTGDQTGREIALGWYYNFPWDCILRFTRDDPKPEPTPEPTPTPGGTYVVKSGDSLWAIAARMLGNGADYIKIAELNGIPYPYNIYPGQVLKLPGFDPQPEPEPTPEPTPSGKTYTVQGGDSLWAVAERLLGSGFEYKRIADANGIGYPYLIYPGQVLIIPEV